MKINEREENGIDGKKKREKREGKGTMAHVEEIITSGYRNMIKRREKDKYFKVLKQLYRALKLGLPKKNIRGIATANAQM